MRLLAFLLTLWALPLAAQAPLESPADSLTLAERARQLFFEGDEKATASRLVNRALDDAPEDADLLTVLLQIRQTGFGLTGRPPFARRMIRADIARRLLAADSTSPHAHDELGRQALNEYLFDRDFLAVQVQFGGSGMRPARWAGVPRRSTSGAETDGFNRPGRYDLQQIRAVYPYTTRPGMDDALRETRAHLQSAVRHGGVRFAEPLATLLVFERDHDALLRLAESTGETLWEAAALFRLGRIAAADSAYREAIRALPPEAARDLDDPARVRPDDPPADAEAFWAEQDPRRLTPENERLLEHRTRVLEADVMFGWEGSEPGRDTPRGRIYVRYGSPADRATLTQAFYAGDAQVTTMGESVMTPHFEVWEYETGLRYVFYDPVWSGDYAVYAPSAVNYRGSALADADDYIKQDQRLRRDNPDASQYATAETVDLVLDVVPFQGANGGTDLVVAAEALAPLPDGPVRSAALLLRDGATVETRLDSAAAAVPLVPLASGTVWTRAAQFSAASGDLEVRMEVDGADGETAGWSHQPVEATAWGGGLQLSGVLLARGLDEGRAAGPGEIARGGSIVQPAAGGVFASGDPVGLYAEVYGLAVAAGESRYAVQASLVPTDGRPGVLRAIGGLFGRGSRRGVSVEVEETARGATAPIALLLDASRQRAGTYTLTLTVTDRATGESVEATRAVTLE